MVSTNKIENNDYLLQIYCNNNIAGDNNTGDVIALSSEDEENIVIASEVENQNFCRESSLDLEDECSQDSIINSSNTPTPHLLNIEGIDDKDTKQISQLSSSNTSEVLVENTSTIQKDQKLQHPIISCCSSSSSATNSQLHIKKLDKITSNLKDQNKLMSSSQQNNSHKLEINEEAEFPTKFKDFSIETLLNKS